MHRYVTRQATISAASQRASEAGVYPGKFTIVQGWVFNNFSTDLFNYYVLSVNFLPSTRDKWWTRQSLFSLELPFGGTASTRTEEPTHTDKVNHRANKMAMKKALLLQSGIHLSLHEDKNSERQPSQKSGEWVLIREISQTGNCQWPRPPGQLLMLRFSYLSA